MKNLQFAICLVTLPFWLATIVTDAHSAQPGSADSNVVSETKEPSTRYQSLVQELKVLQEGLAVKEAELVKLRHKWIVNKGRTPTKDELKEFEKKRAKGEVKIKDNPFVNKSPLSTPGRWREAYYKKLAEINQDKEKAIRLKQEIDSLKH